MWNGSNDDLINGYGYYCDELLIYNMFGIG
jgi:hypothetical protein